MSILQASRNPLPNRAVTVKLISSIKRLFLVAFLFSVCAALALGIFSHFNGHKRDQFKKACKLATRTQNWSELRQKSEAWLKWDSRDDDARLYLAESCAQQGEYETADEILHEIQPDSKHYLAVLALRADLLFSSLNKPLEAEELWQEILRIEPAASVPQQRLIYWYALTLQRRKLINQITLAIQQESEPPEAYAYLFLAQDLNFSDGLPLTTRWRQTYPDDPVLEIAQAIYSARQTNSNLLPTFGTSTVSPGDQTLLQNCLKKYPSELEPIALAIEQAIYAGDAKAVAELLKLASSAAQEDSRFWRYRGWLLMSNQNYAKAEEAFRFGLELQPWDWGSRLFLADVLRKQAKQDDAEKEAKIAMNGKELKTEILLSPNARDLEEKTVNRILEYFGTTGPGWVYNAMKKRM